MKKEWIFIGSDVGAMARQLAAKDARFKRLHVVLDTGHEDAVYLRDLLQLLSVMGGRRFASLHGYCSPKAQDMLLGGGSLHKSRSFLLHVASPAVMRTFAREFLLTNPDGTSSQTRSWVRRDRNRP